MPCQGLGKIDYRLASAGLDQECAEKYEVEDIGRCDRYWSRKDPAQSHRQLIDQLLNRQTPVPERSGRQASSNKRVKQEYPGDNNQGEPDHPSGRFEYKQYQQYTNQNITEKKRTYQLNTIDNPVIFKKQIDNR